jgi:ribosomal protein S4
MPYAIVKSGDQFQLRNKNTKKLLAKKFKTRASAKKFSDRYETKKNSSNSSKSKVPKGSHRMPDGSIMKDSAMKKKSSY